MADIPGDILDILRQKAETALSGMGTAAAGRHKGSIDALFHELQVYQLELEMQVDELRLSSHALEIQKDKFKHLFEFAPVSYIVIDRQGIVRDINRSGIALLGASGKAGALGKPLRGFIHTTDIDTFYLFLKSLFYRGEEEPRLLRLINKSRGLTSVQVSGTIFRENEQEPVCYLTITNVSELQEAELKLKLAKRKLEIALDSSMTGIWEADTRSGHIFLDDFCRGIFDFKPFGFDNRIESLLARIHADDRVAFERGLRKSIVSNTQFMIEFRVQTNLTPDVKYIQARARGTESNEFIGIMIDFTEKRQLEKEAKRLAEETEQLILSAAIAAEEKEKQRISEALHDGIAQQLYGLKLSLDAFKDTLGSGYRHFDALLNNTIADVRNISFELTPAILVDFGLIETLKELAKRLSGSNLKISLNLNPGLKNLQTDIQLSIYRIVQELVNNSIRHGKAGHISIGIEINDGAVAVSVIDNGAGFSVKNRKAHNSGTGLASIRNRLKLYDGTLNVISKLKKGTSVSIILKQFH